MNTFFFSGWVFLPRDYRLDFDIRSCENSINHSMQVIDYDAIIINSNLHLHKIIGASTTKFCTRVNFEKSLK